MGECTWDYEKCQTHEHGVEAVDVCDIYVESLRTRLATAEAEAKAANERIEELTHRAEWVVELIRFAARKGKAVDGDYVINELLGSPALKTELGERIAELERRLKGVE